jgi:cell division septum initiation protein DivIVA
VDATRESEELVTLWQELQEAQVTGDARTLSSIGARAAAESGREGASGEWALLAREAGRNAERVHDEAAAEASVAVGAADDTALDNVLDTVPGETEQAPEGEQTGRRRGRKGSLIWIAFVLGWALLQIVQGFGEG